MSAAASLRYRLTVPSPRPSARAIPGRQVLVKPQHDARALPRRQATERAEYRVPGGHLLGHVRRLSGLPQQRCHPPPAGLPASTVDEQVDHDRPDVGLGPAGRGTRSAGERPHQGLLHEVVGLRVVAAQQERAALQRRAALGDKSPSVCSHRSTSHPISA